MERLNDKIKSSSEENHQDAQVAGLYGYNTTDGKWKRLEATDNNELKVDLAIDESTLATSANQLTMINGTLRDINNTTSIGDGSSNATTISLGYDRSNGKGRAILVDSNGKVEVNSTMNSGHGLATEANQTNGDQKAMCMGIDTATSLQHQLKVASDGALHIISENADSMLIKGIESGTTTQRDCKQNANGDLRVQLIGNDGNDGAGTMRIIKCDANGVLASSGGGAGGTQYATGVGGATTGNLLIALDDTSGNTTALMTTDPTASGINRLQVTDGNITACNTGAVVVSSSALPSGASTSANQTLSFLTATLINAGTAVADGASDDGRIDFTNSIKLDGTPKEIYITTTMSPAVNGTISVSYSVDDSNYFSGSSFAPAFVYSTTSLTTLTDLTGGGVSAFIPPRYLRFTFTNNDGTGQSTDISLSINYWG